MIEFVDAAPGVEVDTEEYVRLLGFPAGHTLAGRSLELAGWVREWYAAYGRPWMYARQSRTLAMDTAAIQLDGVTFRSDRLRRALERAGAQTVMFSAVSAGREIELQARKAWLDEKPDEYFFLETYGSAVVEQLTTSIGARVCAWAEGQSMAVLPHYSPGYPGWDVAEQAPLLSVIGREDLPGTLDVLESGMLLPKKSQLAVFGITRHTDRVLRPGERAPCESCSYARCQFRRRPYRRTPDSHVLETTEP